MCVVPARGQVESKAAAVTLIARVQEAFALVPMERLTEVADSANPTSGPREMQIALSWRLRQGRTFRVGYELADESADHPNILFEGAIVPSQVQDAVPVLSFLPEVSKTVKPIGVWGNRETDPSGLAGLLIGLPQSGQLQHPLIRLRAIIP